MCVKCTESTRSDQHQDESTMTEDESAAEGEKENGSGPRPKLVSMSTADKMHLAPVHPGEDSAGQGNDGQDEDDEHDPGGSKHDGSGSNERDGGKPHHPGESTFGTRPSPPQHRRSNSTTALEPATCSGHGASISRAWAKPTFNEVRREVQFASPPYPEHISSGTPDETVEWLVRNCKILWGPVKDMLGYDPEDIEPTFDWWAERTHPEDLIRLKGEIWEYCLPKRNRGSAEARLWNGVYRFKKKEGGWITLGDRMNTIRSEEGYPTLAESYMYDHGARVDERSRLKAIGSENDFQIVCGNMYSAIFMMNSSGYVTFMNPAAERLTGFKFEEISKVTFHEAVHSLRPDASAYPISECPIYLAQVNNQKLTNAPEVFVDRQGRFFPVSYSVAPLHGGYEHGAVIEFRDVSDEVRLAEDRMKALRQNEQKSAKIKQEEFLRQNMAVFTDFLCHEVRNPLHGIAANKNFLQESIQQMEDMLQPFMEQERKADSENSKSSKKSRKPSLRDGAQALFASMRGYLQAIDECAGHQGMILNSVLDLSRLEMGALKLGSEPFSPYEIALQAVKMSRAQGEGRNVKIELEADEETKRMVVKGDPTPVRQVFLNLLGNGIKFSHSGGTVTAKMKLHQYDHTNKYQMEGMVQDEGVGMTQVEVGRLFQRFADITQRTLRQANQRVSEVYGGSGLGLSISKELLKLMEGELKVQSEKGQGSQFMFTAKFEKLSKAEMTDFRNKDSRPATPTIDGVGTLTQTRKHARKTTKRRFTHIVAAEDNALNRKILAKYLQKSENLVLVNDGQQAVDYYKEHSHEIDIIIMDQEMPMLDGRQATMAIREYEKELEVIDSKENDQAKLRNGPGERRKRKEWSHRVPIIALSGNVRTEQIAEAKAAGMDDYLKKPCSKTSLEEMLTKWEEIVLGPVEEEKHTETDVQSEVRPDEEDHWDSL